jgi:hypothetical protein
MKKSTLKSLIIFALTTVIIIGVYLFVQRENNKPTSEAPFSAEEFSCAQLEREAKSILKSYNYCDSNQDCEVVDEYVYDCYFLANRNADTSEVNIIQKTAIEKQCPLPVFDCLTVNLKAECKNNKCVIAK